MNKLRLVLIFLMGVLTVFTSQGGNILDKFSVKMEDAYLAEFSENSLKLESKSRKYSVNLSPQLEGPVAFSLSRHAYRATIRPKKLFFGVKIEGFKNGEAILPSFTVGNFGEELFIDGNFVIFTRISEPIPVLFEDGVDSINLHFSNSHNFNFHQYFSIDELQIIGNTITESNPVLLDCENHSIMIAVQRSSAINKTDRKSISKEISEFLKNPNTTEDSSAVCIMEFGKSNHRITESVEKKELLSSMKSYKKNGDKSNARSAYINWGSALDEAIIRKPDIFILVTNSYSNYNVNGPASINAQHTSLVSKCNRLKSNGTRLLFITSGMYDESKSNMTLLSMLNQEDTRKLVNGELSPAANLKDVDLISMDDFKDFKLVNLHSLVKCSEPTMSLN